MFMFNIIFDTFGIVKIWRENSSTLTEQKHVIQCR